jgi:hypothetical protein
MRYPRVGVRGEVSVVGKNILAGDVCGKLYEKAGIAQPNMEWIEDLRIVQPCPGDVAFTKWRHPEVDERTRKLGTAQPTFMRR